MNAPAKIEAGPPLVYQRIAAVQGELAKVGIAKSRRNQQQNYSFRGIDDVYSALSPLLAQHGLVIVPRVIERDCVEGQTRKGDPLFRVTVKAEFDFIAAEDGSVHTASTYGEAMDSADKATNKAMSAAYKYAAFMTFAIPTEGDNDADSTTHEVASDPAKPLSDTEWAHLVMLCQSTATQGDEVKAHIGAANLRALTGEQHKKALEYLETKLAAKTKAETDAKAKEPA